MTAPSRFLIEAPAGFRSAAAGVFVAQLDDLSRRRGEAFHDVTAAELEWQLRPGMNTIGMLLAHMAIVEVVWMDIGPLGLAEPRVEGVLGLGRDDDGMPLPEGATSPALLRGKDLAWYEGLFTRARAHTKEVAAGLTDADLDRQLTRTRPDGSQRTFNLRWVLHHLVEHDAGHYGQALLLRHLRRAPG